MTNTLLFVSHYPFYGGPQNRMLHLSKPLQRAGWRTLVVLPDEPGNARARLEAADVAVIPLQLSRLRALKDPRVHIKLLLGYWRDVQRLRALIRAEAADIVVVAGLANAQGAIAAHLEGKALIWQVLDTRTPNPVVRVTVPLMRRIADVVMTTGTTVAAAHEGLTDLGQHLVPFYSPVDVEKFSPSRADAGTLLESIGYSSDRCTVGVVANLTPQKGLENFVRMAEAVGATRDDVQFLIVGSVMETQLEYLREIQAQISRTAMHGTGRLRIVDPGTDVAAWLRAFDVFVLSSADRSEGIPTAVLEALATAVPVVAVDVGGIREVVLDGQVGVVVESPENLASAVEGLLADPRRLSMMGHAAREMAVEKFSTERCVATHLKAIGLALTRRDAR